MREIFVALLPGGYILDGSSVVQLTCGPKGSEPHYRQVLGSSEYYVEDFDFLAYGAAPPQERQEILLDMIEAALRHIAALGERLEEAIVAAAAQVRDIGFSLTLPVPKLTKGIPGTSCSVQVFRQLSPEHGEIWTARVLKRGVGLVKEVAIGPRPNYLDGRGLYQQAAIEGGSYLLRHRLGHVHFSYDLAQLGLETSND